MLDTLYAAQEPQYLLGTQDNRQLLGSLGRRVDVLQTPIPMECHFVKKTQSGHGDENGTGSQLLFVGQIDLVRTISSGPSTSGDLLKWRANSETCCT
jgi:hypothetical protein